MTNFDMTPLYRSTIGFDRLANTFDALGATNNSSAFPPYNVARTGETDYRISMAVAGFAEDELEYTGSAKVKSSELLALASKRLQEEQPEEVTA